MFVLVLSYFTLTEVSHDVELPYGSFCVHTLLSVNNQDFSKTSVSGRTSVVSEGYNFEVDVHEVHGRGIQQIFVTHSLNVTHVSYRCLLAGALEQCKLWLLAVGHPDVNTPSVGCAEAKQISIACLQHSFY